MIIFSHMIIVNILSSCEKYFVYLNLDIRYNTELNSSISYASCLSMENSSVPLKIIFLISKIKTRVSACLKHHYVE